jgi:hypothetical protein
MTNGTTILLPSGKRMLRDGGQQRLAAGTNEACCCGCGCVDGVPESVSVTITGGSASIDNPDGVSYGYPDASCPSNTITGDLVIPGAFPTINGTYCLARYTSTNEACCSPVTTPQKDGCEYYGEFDSDLIAEWWCGPDPYELCDPQPENDWKLTITLTRLSGNDTFLFVGIRCAIQGVVINNPIYEAEFAVNSPTNVCGLSPRSGTAVVGYTGSASITIPCP